MKERYDENGHLIGDGSWHHPYHIEEFPGLNLRITVQKSATTESVYVFYMNRETLEYAKVRFSSHISNDLKYGAVIDGKSPDARNEILFRIGLMTKTFIPRFVNHIHTQYVAKKKLHLYEEADKTIAELTALPAGTDISEYRGKIAKGTTLMITSDKILSVQRGGDFKYTEK